MFQRNLQNLRNLELDNLIVDNNLSVSGNIISNTANNLSISYTNQQTEINSITTTTTYINTGLQTFKNNQNIINNLVGVSVNTIDTNERNLSVSQTNFINSQNTFNNLIGISSGNLQITDNFLQSQINNLANLGISNQNVDTQISISCAVFDSKLGFQLGISNPQFLTRNETTLPNTFTSSSLTSLGTIGTLNIGGNESVSGNLNVSGLLTTTGNSLFVGNLTISGVLTSTSDFFAFC